MWYTEGVCGGCETTENAWRADENAPTGCEWFSHCTVKCQSPPPLHLPLHICSPLVRDLLTGQCKPWPNKSQNRIWRSYRLIELHMSLAGVSSLLLNAPCIDIHTYTGSKSAMKWTRLGTISISESANRWIRLGTISMNQCLKKIAYKTSCFISNFFKHSLQCI